MQRFRFQLLSVVPHPEGRGDIVAVRRLRPRGWWPQALAVPEATEQYLLCFHCNRWSTWPTNERCPTSLCKALDELRDQVTLNNRLRALSEDSSASRETIPIPLSQLEPMSTAG